MPLRRIVPCWRWIACNGRLQLRVACQRPRSHTYTTMYAPPTNLQSSCKQMMSAPPREGRGLQPALSSAGASRVRGHFLALALRPLYGASHRKEAGFVAPALRPRRAQIRSRSLDSTRRFRPSAMSTSLMAARRGYRGVVFCQRHWPAGGTPLAIGRLISAGSSAGG